MLYEKPTVTDLGRLRDDEIVYAFLQTSVAERDRLRVLCQVLAGSLHHAPQCGVHDVAGVQTGCTCGCADARLAWSAHAGGSVQHVEFVDGAWRVAPA